MLNLLLALPLLAPVQSCPTTTSYGQGCAGVGSIVPQLALTGDLTTGPNLSLDLTDVHGGSIAVLVVGDTPTALPVGGGCNLLVGPLYIAPAVLVPGAGPGQGSLALPIPDDLALSPISLTFQYFAHHPATGLTSTDALQVGFDPACAATKTLIQIFSGGSTAAADLAYEELAGRGVDAISQLIALGLDSASSAQYPGEGPDIVHSSLVRTTDAPISTMAFYAVEAILSGFSTPYRSFEIVDDTLASSTPEADAVAVYAAWWQANQGQALDVLQAGPRALDGSNLSWAGGRMVAPTFPTTEEPEKDPLDGVNNDGCPTPYRKTKGGKAIAKAGSKPEEGKFIFCGVPILKPGVGLSVSTPFNCLAWALGCFKDRWLQPNGPLSAHDIATNHGFAAHFGPFLSTSTPGAGVMAGAMLIYDENGKWVHAMKWDPMTGTWSSKNGSGQTTSNIKPGQVDAFLDSIPAYSVPPGTMRTYGIYSK